MIGSLKATVRAFLIDGVLTAVGNAAVLEPGTLAAVGIGLVRRRRSAHLVA